MKKQQRSKKSAKKRTKVHGTARKHQSSPSKRAPEIVIEGPKSVMTFASAAGLKKLEETLIFRQYHQKTSDIAFCKVLETIFSKSGPPSDSFVNSENIRTLFRITTSLDPLEAAVTLGNGGRVNIGFSQLCEEMPNVKASYGIYVAFDKATAIAEVGSAGLPFGPGDHFYEIIPKAPDKLRFIDFDAAVMFLGQMINGVSLAATVQESPAAACWGLQKWPKPSQIVAEWLRSGLAAKSDGICYSSAKNPSSKNVFLFAENASSLHKKFTHREVAGIP
jgi:hypothetical protein